MIKSLHEASLSVKKKAKNNIARGKETKRDWGERVLSPSHSSLLAEINPKTRHLDKSRYLKYALADFSFNCKLLK